LATEPNTGVGIVLKSGSGEVTITSAVTLTGGGSTVEVVCDSADSTTQAGNANLSLLKIDALN
jgi:hypothetical protein